MNLPTTYTRTNIIHGMVFYAAGDALATLIVGKFFIWRVLGMMLVGGGIYALEIPAYFAWIARKTSAINGWKGSLLRTAMACVYFNPLWIARHLLFIALFSGAWSGVSPALLTTATLSFLVSVPISLAGNFVIQTFLPERHRFLGSSVFSGVIAVYYALSAIWFA
jgi:hypothetical protein